MDKSWIVKIYEFLDKVGFLGVGKMIRFKGKVIIKYNGDGMCKVSWTNGGIEQELSVLVEHVVGVIRIFLVEGYEVIVDKLLDKMDEIRILREAHYI